MSGAWLLGRGKVFKKDGKIEARGKQLVRKSSWKLLPAICRWKLRFMSALGTGYWCTVRWEPGRHKERVRVGRQSPLQGCIYFAEFVFAKLELGIFLHYERRQQIDLIWFDFEVDKPALSVCFPAPSTLSTASFILLLPCIYPAAARILGCKAKVRKFVTSAARSPTFIQSPRRNLPHLIGRSKVKEWPQPREMWISQQTNDYVNIWHLAGKRARNTKRK